LLENAKDVFRRFDGLVLGELFKRNPHFINLRENWTFHKDPKQIMPSATRNLFEKSISRIACAPSYSQETGCLTSLRKAATACCFLEGV
jgi:hypothetical protein